MFGPHVGLARADVDRLRIRRSDRKGADGGERLSVGQWIPRGAGISGSPHTAGDAAEIERGRVAGNAFDHQRPSAAEWSDESPPHCGVRAGRG